MDQYTSSLHEKKEFACYEKENHLFDRLYNGRPYWFYIRFLAYNYACGGGVMSAGTERVLREENPLKRSVYPMLAAFRRTIQEVCFGKRYQKADLLMVIQERTLDGSIPKNRQLQYISMPKNISVFRIFDSPGYIAENLSMIDRTCAWPYCKTIVYRMLQKLFPRHFRDRKESEFLKWLEADVKQKFGASYSAELMERDIQVFEATRRAYRKSFQKLLDAVQPKAIFLAEYYSHPNLILIELANERGIPVIEAMHGVVRNHQSYYFEDQRGVNVFVPDYFLTFGKWQTKWCKFLPRTREIETGYPYRDRIVKKYQTEQCDEKQIIFYPNTITAYEEFVVEFAKLAKAAGYTVKCKFHPMECLNWKEYYPVLATCGDIIPITDPACNVYQCIFGAKYHVFGDTTVIYETAPIPGREVFVLDMVPHYQSQPFVDDKIATLIQEPQQLLAEIQRAESGASHRKVEIWKPNAKKNMERFFRKMAEQNWPYPADFVMD